MSLQRVKLSVLASLLGMASMMHFAHSAETQEDKRETQNLLQKIRSAAQKLNYSGTFVYQQASQIRTSRITHLVDASGEVEKLEILDGKPREYIRHNDEVACYLPDTKTIQVEKNVTQEVFPAMLANNAALLPDIYAIRKQDMGRVAGMPCQIVSFEPRDAFRYGYRLCMDNSSGLLLRAQTVNNKNEIIEQIAFTQISIGDIDKSRVKSSFPNTSQWQTENLTVQSNANSGWIVKSLPAGFKKTREMKRLIPISPAAAANSTEAKAHQVIQMIFSDGLAAISVFIEPDSQGRSEGSLQQGAMTIMVKRHGDYWLTVVGEVPFPAIKQVMNSIEYKPK
ncbi:MucB/RseB C-terminal domain-containing protein [Undibacterium terreum]|uniref:Sigma factor regulatory protein n=1 Tax=Undibacterium terreum TaxID=1224302 RepID=A0A916UVX2_9BURK|nr:MucB/RseB C-terminal domain-containing protein [Undibacterium terreum]GGC91072.1 sigma factor regulatory protein [Undibacterium terreum]